MAQRASWPNRKGLQKHIQGKHYYLGRACDLTSGKGWFCEVFDTKFNMGFGFHKANKFSAVRNALADLKDGGLWK